LHPTLHFPAGTYSLSRGLELDHDIRYLGDGRDATILQCNSNFLAPAQSAEKLALFIAQGPGRVLNTEIRGLMLDANQNMHNRSTNGYGALVMCNWDQPSPSSNLRFIDVRLKTLVPNSGCVSLQNARYVTVAGCEFIGGELFLARTDRTSITRSAFFGANHQERSIGELQNNNFSITDSHFEDYDISSAVGRGQGRLLGGSAHFGAQYNAYIGNNTTLALGPNPGDNGGEQVLCEGAEIYHAGFAVSATATSVTFSGLDPALCKDQTAVICVGKGLGQFRKIAGYDKSSHRIVVSPAWNVIPDATSKILIEGGTCRWLLYNNHFDGKDFYATAYTAMAAIELFGGCYDWIVAGNRITQMRQGWYDGAVEQSSPGTENNPIYFNYFANNVVQSCYYGIQHGGGRLVSDTVVSVGNLFRNNKFVDVASMGINLWVTVPDLPSPAAVSDMVVFEHNSFTNVNIGANLDPYDAGGYSRNAIFYENQFTAGTQFASNSYGVKIGANSNPAFHNNTWNDFLVTYAGTLPGAILEVPFRTFTLQTLPATPAAAVAVKASILNSGTAALDWTATSDSPWLTLSASRGTVPDELTNSSLTLSCSPTGLPIGTYAGTVSILFGTQIKKIVVSFTVAWEVAPPTEAKIRISEPAPRESQ